MTHSPYLDINRDLDTLRAMIRDYEEMKTDRQTVTATIERTFLTRDRNAREPVYARPVAFAS